MRPSRLLLLLPAALLACSSPVVDTDPSPSTVSQPGPGTAAVFLPVSGDVQVLRSGEDPNFYAASCTGAPSVRLGAGVSLRDPLPDGVSLVGEELSLPSGAEGFVFALATSGAVDSVYLRCLPEGFPRIDVEGGFADWLALTTLPTEPSVRPFRMILDTSGFPVWFQEGDGATTDFFAADGTLVAFATGARPFDSFSNDPGAGFHRFGYDGGILGSWVPATGPGLDFHALALLPGGNALALVYERTNAPLPAGTGPLPVQPERGRENCPSVPPTPSSASLRGRVIEVAPDGEVVRVWRVEDHLPDAPVSATWVNASPSSDGSDCVVDAEHLNALAFYADAPGSSSGRVLLTGRHMDGAAMISWPGGEVLWTLGGHAGADALEIVGDPLGGPVRPHDANLLGEDRVLIYDNRMNGEASRAVVYRLDLAARRAVLEESYATICEGGPCAAFAMGSSRRTLSGDGVPVGWGTASVTASEFALGADRPRAELRLGGTWAYRVLPVERLDRVELFRAQDRLAPLP